jgi:hypothetical protein
MITIAWYNIVAIVLIMALIYFLYKLFVEKEKNIYAAFYDGIKYLVLSVATFLLLLVWGGIFWW